MDLRYIRESNENEIEKRTGAGSEVANTIVFLASHEASYITGGAPVVDGGNTIQEYKGDSKYYC